MAKHVVIVGGGVIGLCSAYYAAQKGHRVTILERGSPGHDCCSIGNAGMIVPSHVVPLAAPGAVGFALRSLWNPESPFHVRPRLDADLLAWGLRFWRSANAAHVARSAPLLRDLHLASRSCYEELAESQGNDFGLVRRGLLMLCRTRHALDEEIRIATLIQRLGIPAEVLDAEQTAERDPSVRMAVAGSVFFPKDCHMLPHRFVTSLIRRLESAGATLSWQTEVTGWIADGVRVKAVRTSRGEIAAEEFVLACGAWSPAVARHLRLKLPMQAGKGYSLTLTRPRCLPTLCSILSEARVAVTPMDSALRFGGTMEIAGLDESINPARVRGIVKAVPEYLPDFASADFDGVRPWCGLRPCSADGLPFIGRTSRFPNLVVATGHAMMGMSLGPITGRLVAQIVSGEQLSINIEALSPDRFA
ncbi:MAG TPA: FAD-dependent oxidoreductase [Acidobacteriota bacterium]|nr:FAD-dependent oxidoreductase [Acidobacteriota bacterium]